jgi:hypothetical protein
MAYSLYYPVMSETPPGLPLSETERAELERLRAEAAARSHRGARAGRWTGAIVLMVLASLIGLTSLTAVWLRSQVLNTERYVETVAPLASDPVIQAAVAARLSAEIVAKLDIQGLAMQAVEALEDRGAPRRLGELVPPLVSGLQSFLNDKIREVVASQRFAEFWANANRMAHEQVEAVLTGKGSKLVSTDNTAIVIDLGQVL